jgi:hypothetical protein
MACTCSPFITEIAELCDECMMSLQESIPPTPVEFDKIWEKVKDEPEGTG